MRHWVPQRLHDFNSLLSTDQHPSPAVCFERMSVYEVRHRVRFDWILRTRTDTAYLSYARPAVQPHCLTDTSSVLLARSFSKGATPGGRIYLPRFHLLATSSP